MLRSAFGGGGASRSPSGGRGASTPTTTAAATAGLSTSPAAATTTPGSRPVAHAVTKRTGHSNSGGGGMAAFFLPSLLKKTKTNQTGAKRLATFTKRVVPPPITDIQVKAKKKTNKPAVTVVTDHHAETVAPAREPDADFMAGDDTDGDDTKVSSLTDVDGLKIIEYRRWKAEQAQAAAKKNKTTTEVQVGSKIAIAVSTKAAAAAAGNSSSHPITTTPTPTTALVPHVPSDTTLTLTTQRGTAMATAAATAALGGDHTTIADTATTTKKDHPHDQHHQQSSSSSSFRDISNHYNKNKNDTSDRQRGDPTPTAIAAIAAAAAAAVADPSPLAPASGSTVSTLEQVAPDRNGPRRAKAVVTATGEVELRNFSSSTLVSTPTSARGGGIAQRLMGEDTMSLQGREESEQSSQFSYSRIAVTTTAAGKTSAGRHLHPLQVPKDSATSQTPTASTNKKRLLLDQGLHLSAPSPISLDKIILQAAAAASRTTADEGAAKAAGKSTHPAHQQQSSLMVLEERDEENDDPLETHPKKSDPSGFSVSRGSATKEEPSGSRAITMSPLNHNQPTPRAAAASSLRQQPTETSRSRWAPSDALVSHRSAAFADMPAEINVVPQEESVSSLSAPPSGGGSSSPHTTSKGPGSQRSSHLLLPEHYLANPPTPVVAPPPPPRPPGTEAPKKKIAFETVRALLHLVPRPPSSQNDTTAPRQSSPSLSAAVDQASGGGVGSSSAGGVEEKEASSSQNQPTKTPSPHPTWFVESSNNTSGGGNDEGDEKQTQAMERPRSALASTIVANSVGPRERTPRLEPPDAPTATSLVRVRQPVDAPDDNDDGQDETSPDAIEVTLETENDSTQPSSSPMLESTEGSSGSSQQPSEPHPSGTSSTSRPNHDTLNLPTKDGARSASASPTPKLWQVVASALSSIGMNDTQRDAHPLEQRAPSRLSTGSPTAKSVAPNPFDDVVEPDGKGQQPTPQQRSPSRLSSASPTAHSKAPNPFDDDDDNAALKGEWASDKLSEHSMHRPPSRLSTTGSPTAKSIAPNPFNDGDNDLVSGRSQHTRPPSRISAGSPSAKSVVPNPFDDSSADLEDEAEGKNEKEKLSPSRASVGSPSAQSVPLNPFSEDFEAPVAKAMLPNPFDDSKGEPSVKQHRPSSVKTVPLNPFDDADVKPTSNWTNRPKSSLSHATRLQSTNPFDPPASNNTSKAFSSAKNNLHGRNERNTFEEQPPTPARHSRGPRPESMNMVDPPDESRSVRSSKKDGTPGPGDLRGSKDEYSLYDINPSGAITSFDPPEKGSVSSTAQAVPATPNASKIGSPVRQKNHPWATSAISSVASLRNKITRSPFDSDGAESHRSHGETSTKMLDPELMAVAQLVEHPSPVPDNNAPNLYETKYLGETQGGMTSLSLANMDDMGKNEAQLNSGSRGPSRMSSQHSGRISTTGHGQSNGQEEPEETGAPVTQPLIKSDANIGRYIRLEPEVGTRTSQREKDDNNFQETRSVNAPEVALDEMDTIEDKSKSGKIDNVSSDTGLETHGSQISSSQGALIEKSTGESRGNDGGRSQGSQKGLTSNLMGILPTVGKEDPAGALRSPPAFDGYRPHSRLSEPGNSRTASEHDERSRSSAPGQVMSFRGKKKIPEEGSGAALSGGGRQVQVAERSQDSARASVKSMRLEPDGAALSVSPAYADVLSRRSSLNPFDERTSMAEVQRFDGPSNDVVDIKSREKSLMAKSSSNPFEDSEHEKRVTKTDSKSSREPRISDGKPRFTPDNTGDKVCIPKDSQSDPITSVIIDMTQVNDPVDDRNQPRIRALDVADARVSKMQPESIDKGRAASPSVRTLTSGQIKENANQINAKKSLEAASFSGASISLQNDTISSADRDEKRREKRLAGGSLLTRDDLKLAESIGLNDEVDDASKNVEDTVVELDETGSRLEPSSTTAFFAGRTRHGTPLDNLSTAAIFSGKPRYSAPHDASSTAALFGGRARNGTPNDASSTTALLSGKTRRGTSYDEATWFDERSHGRLLQSPSDQSGSEQAKSLAPRLRDENQHGESRKLEKVAEDLSHDDSRGDGPVPKDVLLQEAASHPSGFLDKLKEVLQPAEANNRGQDEGKDLTLIEMTSSGLAFIKAEHPDARRDQVEQTEEMREFTPTEDQTKIPMGENLQADRWCSSVSGAASLVKDLNLQTDEKSAQDAKSLPTTVKSMIAQLEERSHLSAPLAKPVSDRIKVLPDSNETPGRASAPLLTLSPSPGISASSGLALTPTEMKDKLEPESLIPSGLTGKKPNEKHSRTTRGEAAFSGTKYLMVQTNHFLGSSSDEDIPAPPVDSAAVMAALESSLPPMSSTKARRRSPRKKKSPSGKKNKKPPSSPLMESNRYTKASSILASTTSESSKLEKVASMPVQYARVGEGGLAKTFAGNDSRDSRDRQFPREIALAATEPVSDLDQSRIEQNLPESHKRKAIVLPPKSKRSAKKSSDLDSRESLDQKFPKEIALTSNEPISDLDQSFRHFPLRQVIASNSVDVSGLGQSIDDDESMSSAGDMKNNRDRYVPRIPHNEDMEVEGDIDRDRYEPVLQLSRPLNDSATDAPRGERALADSISEVRTSSLSKSKPTISGSIADDWRAKATLADPSLEWKPDSALPVVDSSVKRAVAARWKSKAIQESRAALADSITDWSVEQIESDDGTGQAAVEVMLSSCQKTPLALTSHFLLWNKEATSALGQKHDGTEEDRRKMRNKSVKNSAPSQGQHQDEGSSAKSIVEPTPKTKNWASDSAERFFAGVNTDFRLKPKEPTGCTPLPSDVEETPQAGSLDPDGKDAWSSEDGSKSPNQSDGGDRYQVAASSELENTPLTAVLTSLGLNPARSASKHMSGVEHLARRILDGLSNQSSEQGGVESSKSEDDEDQNTRKSHEGDEASDLLDGSNTEVIIIRGKNTRNMVTVPGVDVQTGMDVTISDAIIDAIEIQIEEVSAVALPEDARSDLVHNKTASDAVYVDGMSACEVEPSTANGDETDKSDESPDELQILLELSDESMDDPANMQEVHFHSQNKFPPLLSTIHETESDGILSNRSDKGSTATATTTDGSFIDRLMKFGRNALSLSPASKRDLDEKMNNLSPRSKRVLQQSIMRAQTSTAHTKERKEAFVEPEVIDLTDVETLEDLVDDDPVWLYDIPSKTSPVRQMDSLFAFAAVRQMSEEHNETEPKKSNLNKEKLDLDAPLATTANSGSAPVVGKRPFERKMAPFQQLLTSVMMTGTDTQRITESISNEVGLVSISAPSYDSIPVVVKGKDVVASTDVTRINPLTFPLRSEGDVFVIDLSGETRDDLALPRLLSKEYLRSDFSIDTQRWKAGHDFENPIPRRSRHSSAPRRRPEKLFALSSNASTNESVLKSKSTAACSTESHSPSCHLGAELSKVPNSGIGVDSTDDISKSFPQPSGSQECAQHGMVSLSPKTMIEASGNESTPTEINEKPYSELSDFNEDKASDFADTGKSNKTVKVKSKEDASRTRNEDTKEQSPHEATHPNVEATGNEVVPGEPKAKILVVVPGCDVSVCQQTESLESVEFDDVMEDDDAQEYEIVHRFVLASNTLHNDDTSHPSRQRNSCSSAGSDLPASENKASMRNSLSIPRGSKSSSKDRTNVKRSPEAKRATNLPITRLEYSSTGTSQPAKQHDSAFVESLRKTYSSECEQESRQQERKPVTRETESLIEDKSKDEPLNEERPMAESGEKNVARGSADRSSTRSGSHSLSPARSAQLLKDQPGATDRWWKVDKYPHSEPVTPRNRSDTGFDLESDTASTLLEQQANKVLARKDFLDMLCEGVEKLVCGNNLDELSDDGMDQAESIRSPAVSRKERRSVKKRNSAISHDIVNDLFDGAERLVFPGEKLEARKVIPISKEVSKEIAEETLDFRPALCRESALQDKREMTTESKYYSALRKSIGFDPY